MLAITKIAILAAKSKMAAWILSKFTSTALSQGQATFWSHFQLVAITKMAIDCFFSLLMNLLMLTFHAQTYVQLCSICLFSKPYMRIL